MTDVFDWIRDKAGDGSSSLGDITYGLLNAGMTIEAVRQALNTVASNVGTSPAQVAAVQQELAYANSGAASRPDDGKNLLMILGGIGLLWYLTRGDR